MEIRLALFLAAAIATFVPNTYVVAQERSSERAGDRALVLPNDASFETRIVTHESSPSHDCAPLSEDPRRVVRTSQRGNELVDPCGRRSGADTSISAVHGQVHSETSGYAQLGAPPTIDRMTTRVIYDQHTAYGPITLVGSADVYELSDGSQWSSGAGSFYRHGATLRRIEISGETIRYLLSSTSDSLIYEQTDYNGGDHTVQGTLTAASDLVIEATLGSHIGVLHGNAMVASNDEIDAGDPRFNYYSAAVGTIVPFETTITLSDDVWTETTFERAFNYSSSGWVDFAHPIPATTATNLTISGPGRIFDQSSTTFIAQVHYDDGTQRDVSIEAAWSVEPASLASITQGVLTVGVLPTTEQLLTLSATYTEGDVELTVDKQVHCLADLPVESPSADSWPMFQADSRHTGSLAIELAPTLFSLKWQRDIGGDFALNPVAAGDGKVFVSLHTRFDDVTSLFALQASDGATVWSKGFGYVYSTNPPSYAYGNVYIQTGNHATDTWLHALDGETGEVVFQAPHSAQWENYYAPTIHAGKVYVNGGGYGGMYAFDALTGDQQWFADLPQYDLWTPAVDGERVYAYLGKDFPGLHGADPSTGTPTLFTADPNFVWNGWSMNLAPVIGAFNDVIVIHDGRLIIFDTNNSIVRWELQDQFSGQPSVSHGRIYAINDGGLVVLDELTHASLWTWQPPADVLSGPMIVTDSHVLVSGAERVYAVDLSTRQPVWSYPVSGQLALADDTLYVASEDGTLTAFVAPRDLIFRNAFE